MMMATEEQEATSTLVAVHDDPIPDDVNLLDPEWAEEQRLSRRPNTAHLKEATRRLENGIVVPLFEVGNRIIVERFISFDPRHPWLDTRTCIVRSIDITTGHVDCLDEELGHQVTVGLRDPWTRVLLTPRGNKKLRASTGSTVSVKEKPARERSDGPAKIGRPKGTKNRPREEVAAEKKARMDRVIARREKRERRQAQRLACRTRRSK